MSSIEYDPVTGLPKKKTNQIGLNPNVLGTIGGLINGASASQAAGTPFGGSYTSALGAAPTLRLPGFTPDYASLIQNDPTYSQLRKDYAAQGIADRSQLATARQRAVASFGIVPDFNTLDAAVVGPDFASDINPETRALAQKNTEAGLSTISRLNDANTTAKRDAINALASRGLLRSGETGYQLDNLNKAYTQAVFDATGKLTEFGAGTFQAFTDHQRQLAEQQARAQAEAAARQAALPQNQPRLEQTAFLDPATGLYRAPDGRYFNADGSPAAGPNTGDLLAQIAALLAQQTQAPSTAAPQPSYSSGPITQTPDLTGIPQFEPTPMPPPRPATVARYKPPAVPLSVARGFLGGGRY